MLARASRWICFSVVPVTPLEYTGGRTRRRLLQEDARYRDPNTRGCLEASDALRRYLTKLFDRWQMHWALREAYPFQDAEGAAVLWRATLRPRGGGAGGQVDGMDLALVEGNRLSRNDVYFDRAALASLVSTTV